MQYLLWRQNWFKGPVWVISKPGGFFRYQNSVLLKLLRNQYDKVANINILEQLNLHKLSKENNNLRTKRVIVREKKLFQLTMIRTKFSKLLKRSL